MSGCGIENTVTIVTHRHRSFCGVQGSSLQRALLAGELSADDGATPHTTPQGAIAPFDGSAVKSAFALLLTRVTEPAAERRKEKEVIFMKRTISAMVGKGSINHNSRRFTAENVNPERSHLNIDYCNEPIKKVYHELFDEALKRYNDKQTRADRKIVDYYEMLRNS